MMTVPFYIEWSRNAFLIRWNLSGDLKKVRGLAMQISESQACQVEGTARIEALRQIHAHDTGGTAKS